METAIPFVNAGIPVRQQSVLNQLNPGESDGLTLEELKAKFPDEIVKARENPYRHRYPRAEVTQEHVKHEKTKTLFYSRTMI